MAKNVLSHEVISKDGFLIHLTRESQDRWTARINLAPDGTKLREVWTSTRRCNCIRGPLCYIQKWHGRTGMEGFIKLRDTWLYGQPPERNNAT